MLEDHFPTFFSTLFVQNAIDVLIQNRVFVLIKKIEIQKKNKIIFLSLMKKIKNEKAKKQKKSLTNILLSLMIIKIKIMLTLTVHT